MQYTIDNSGIQPNSDELELIDAKIGLSLSRLNNIITHCEVLFLKESGPIGTNMVSCRLSVSIIKSSDFVVTDRANTVGEAFAITLSRIKRNIEMHLKRSKPRRMTSTLKARTD
ncbi:MAG: hypothetical protein ACJAVV_000011 [Alphaproteobacteria bacterium]|jgi:hypothetical protein